MDRQTETDRLTDRHEDRQSLTVGQRETDRWTGRQTDGQAGRQTDIKTDEQTDRD